MKAAVHFISETPQVYFVPLFSIAIIVTWLVGWGVTLDDLVKWGDTWKDDLVERDGNYYKKFSKE